MYIGTLRTMYFYLALGKYGSYHSDTGSYLEKSILYKVLPNLHYGWANLGRNLAKFQLYKFVNMKVVTPRGSAIVAMFTVGCALLV